MLKSAQIEQLAKEGFHYITAITKPQIEAVRGVSADHAVRTLLASHQGQLTFDFRLDAAPAKILALRRQTAVRVTPIALVAA